MTLPSPSQLLGVPLDYYPDWYPGQEDTFKKIIDWFHSPTRFLGVAAPTGTGKTCLALLIARLSGARTVILTATKGLQEQYMRDARLLGGVSVVGQNNFRCSLVPSLTADEGPCHDGISCSFREDACPYRIQLAQALKSKIVVTNYAYYLAQTNFSSGLGDIGLLILDEGHLAFSSMENYLTLFLSRMDVESLGIHFPKIQTLQPPEPPARASKPKKGSEIPPPENTPPILEPLESLPSEWQQWQEWATESLPTAQAALQQLESDIKSLRQKDQPISGALSRSYRTAKSIVARLERLSSVGEDWIIQQTYHGYRFVPKWVKNYNSHIFRSVPKVILMSAILSHRTADYLGVPPAPDREWVEAKSYFPPENTPIWHIPTARINFRTDDYGSTIWCSRIDQIIQRRLDRKGIIFTVSYDRARFLLQRSRFRDIMLAHSTNDVVYVVNKFKAMKPPAVLVSPVVTTGWNFPAEETNCLIPGTLVRTLSSGYKEIENVRVGDMVLGRTGRFRKVTNVFSRDYSGDVVDIVAFGGMHQYLTPEHPVLAAGAIAEKRGRKAPYWFPVGGLSVGSVLAYPISRSAPSLGRRPLSCKYAKGHTRPTKGKVKHQWDNTPDFWRLVGLWAAEGSIQRAKNPRKGLGRTSVMYAIEFDFNIKEQGTLASNCCDLVARVLGNKRPNPFPTHNNGCRVAIKNNPFAGWLSRNVHRGSNNKRVPPRLFSHATDEDRRAFLQGVLDGDGSRRGQAVDLGVTSSQLALGIRDLALMLGVTATVTLMKNGVWRVYLGGKNTAGFFQRKSRRFALATVRSVKRVHFDGVVYNLEVSKDESYCLPSLCVHNCKYLVLGKIPYPDTRDTVTQSRQDDDKDWTSYLAMETVIQSSGRATRSSTDKCEVLICDDSWKWFWPAYKNFSPKWFQDRVKGSLTCVPDPLV